MYWDCEHVILLCCLSGRPNPKAPGRQVPQADCCVACWAGQYRNYAPGFLVDLVAEILALEGALLDARDRQYRRL